VFPHVDEGEGAARPAASASWAKSVALLGAGHRDRSCLRRTAAREAFELAAAYLLARRNSAPPRVAAAAQRLVSSGIVSSQLHTKQMRPSRWSTMRRVCFPISVRRLGSGAG
jgi:hypothetical protein